MLKRSKCGKGNSTGVKSTSPLRKTSLKRSKGKTITQKKQEKENLEKMWGMFLEIWEERKKGGKVYSELSGEWLGYEPKTLFFDHALEKAQYPEYKYVKENIILVTWKEHSEKGGGC